MNQKYDPGQFRMHEYAVELDKWGISFNAVDKEDSCTIPMVALDINEDHAGCRDLPQEEVRHVLDLGAHVGVFSVAMGLKYPSAMIYAVEPVVENFAMLTHNLHLNKIRHATRNVAVAGESGTISLGTTERNTGGYSFFNTGSTIRAEVPAMTLSEVMNSFVDSEGNRIEKFDLVKLDLEGCEFMVAHTFNEWDRIGRLTVEIHNIAHLPAEDNVNITNGLVEFLLSKLGDRLCAITQATDDYWIWGKKTKRQVLPGERLANQTP